VPEVDKLKSFSGIGEVPMKGLRKAMLTFGEVVEAERSKHAYGELPPGFVDDDAANFSGPHLRPMPTGNPVPAQPDSGGRTVAFSYDEATGDIHFLIQ
jgi:hypothetical protein